MSRALSRSLPSMIPVRRAKSMSRRPRFRPPIAAYLWLSPFTGDVLSGPGTLIDPATQTALTNFVAAGGRLCISGQDVGSALTQGGTVNNDASGFLSSVLGATLATANGGTHLPVPTGSSTTDNRITNTPYYDGVVEGTYPEITTGGLRTTVAPGQRLIRVSNNYGGNVFETVFVPDPRHIPATGARTAPWINWGRISRRSRWGKPTPTPSWPRLIPSRPTKAPMWTSRWPPSRTRLGRWTTAMTMPPPRRAAWD